MAVRLIHVLAATPLILMLGCQSKAPKMDSADFKANVPYVAPVKTVEFKESERKPAGEPDLRWVPATVNIQVRRDTSVVNARAEVNQVLSWNEVIQVESIENRLKMIEKPGICEDLKCTEGGRGKSEAWNAFYSAPKDKKAHALAEAIKGIGKVSSEALVASPGRYFEKKPRDWDDFAREIRRAGDSGVITKAVVTQVLQTYKHENAAALGYAGGSCKIETRSCTLWVEVMVPEKVYVNQTVRREKIRDVRTFNVSAQVRLQRLLSTETDNLQVSINESGFATTSSVSGRYNSYSVTSSPVSENQTGITLVATARMMREMSSNAVRRDRFELVDGQPLFGIELDPEYLPNEEDPGSQLVLEYSLVTCKRVWTGNCAMFGSDKRIEFKKTVIVNQVKTGIPVSIPFDRRGWIVYSLSRFNSSFFSSSPSSERATDALNQ